jgi:hypothetical protein
VKEAIALCQEFTNKISFKKEEQSILVSLEHKYFEDLYKQLKKIEFVLVMKNDSRDFTTAEFVRLNQNSQ